MHSVEAMTICEWNDRNFLRFFGYVSLETTTKFISRKIIREQCPNKYLVPCSGAYVWVSSLSYSLHCNWGKENGTANPAPTRMGATASKQHSPDQLLFNLKLHPSKFSIWSLTICNLTCGYTEIRGTREPLIRFSSNCDVFYPEILIPLFLLSVGFVHFAYPREWDATMDIS